MIDTLLWGSTVLYWPLLSPASDAEVLGHRLVWACVVMLVLVTVTGRVDSLRRVLRDRRTTLLLAGAAVSITVNWAGFVWGATHGHVVEASLGFFMNPLVTVLLGVVVLRESVSLSQVVAIGLATLAVVLVTLAYGRVPWFALMLAGTGGLYGLFKKLAGAGALESLTVETMVVAPFALVWLVVEAASGGSTLLGHGAGHTALLMGGGLVTVTPLIFFGYAVSRVSLVLLGIIGYLAPLATFSLGLLYFHENLPSVQLVGYALVWVALVVFSVDSLLGLRSAGAAAADQVAT